VESEPEWVAIQARQAWATLPCDDVAQVVTGKRVAVVYGISVYYTTTRIKNLCPQAAVGLRTLSVEGDLRSASVYDEAVAV